ncbi:MAG: addiction module protein [Pyrinomonadaceae bacterium]|nr:addiction module protein [Pyrinomonadaceae bacterium]
MNMTLESIEQAARNLTIREKAALAHSLIKDIDGKDEADAEAAWIELAESRLDACLSGEMETVDGDEAMQKLARSLK